jgi:uncharacterized protein YecE (DUF72 family)
MALSAETQTQQAKIYLGTSSWLFDGWRGVFYPEKLPKDQQLSYYAQQFITVEVNTSFYAIPKPATLIHWVEVVPPGFTFTLKFPRAISHEKRLVDCQPETLLFLEVLRSLGPAAGPAFLQLPPDVTRLRDGRALAAYLDWIAGQLNGLPMAVEVRAADLMTPAFAKFVAERGMAFVLVDRVHTVDLYDTWLAMIEHGAAPRFALVRWIGDDKHGPSGDRELTAPRDQDLERWADRLAKLHQAGVAVFGYMHNPYEGHSPASLRRLQERLAKRVALPAWPLTGANDEPPQQMALF